MDSQHQSNQQLPVAFHPTVPLNLAQPSQQPHGDMLDPANIGTIPDPLDDPNMSLGNLQAVMGLDRTRWHKAYYCVIWVGTLSHFLCILTYSCSSPLFVVRWQRSGGPTGLQLQKNGRNGYM